MKGLCGWLDQASRDASDVRTLRRMVAATIRSDADGARILRSGWGGALAISGEDASHVYQDSDRLAAISGSARFTDASLARLASERGLAYAFARAYSDSGSKILELLSGSFALAVLDRNGRALLAVDRSATRPLYYTVKDDTLLFANAGAVETIGRHR